MWLKPDSIQFSNPSVETDGNENSLYIYSLIKTRRKESFPLWLKTLSRPLTSDFCPLPSDLCPLTSVLCPLSSDSRIPSSDSRISSSEYHFCPLATNPRPQGTNSLFYIPLINPSHSFFNTHFVLPAQTVEFGYIREFAHCTVRF